MIGGHILDQGLKKDIIYSFHMPLFIIISGFFFKENEKFSIMFKKSLKTMIIPFLIAIFIDNIEFMLLFKDNNINPFYEFFKQILISYSYDNKISYDFARQLGALWFIPFLFVTKIMFWIINRLAKNNEVLKFVICLLTMICGYYLGVFGYWLPFSVDVAMFSIMFMYAGHIFKKYELLEKILKDYKILLIILIIWIIGIKFSPIDIAIRKYPRVDLSLITAVCGTIIIFKVSELIDLKLKRISKILQWYGKNSILILCAHQIEYRMMSNIYTQVFSFVANIHLYKAIVATIKIAIATVATIILTFPKKKWLKHNSN